MMAEERSVTASVGKLVGAAADLGVAVARTADKVTAGGRDPAPGPPGETAVAAIIRHGVASVVNLVAHVARAVGPGVTGAAGPGPATAAAATPRGVPHVRPGATLRVPLSIENPNREPMTGLAPAVGGWLRDGKAAPDTAAARFEPETLDVGPLDFEKLTVFVSVPETAASGRYRLIIHLAEGVETALNFTVA